MFQTSLYKYRIKIQSFDSKTLNSCCYRLIKAMKEIPAIVKGPIPLPTTKKIYCVLRSPHVNKDSREHFEIRVHKKILDIWTPTNTVFSNLQMPTGALFTIQLIDTYKTYNKNYLKKLLQP